MGDQSEKPGNNYDVSAIDQYILTSIVRQVLNNDGIIIADWHYERVQGGVDDVGNALSGVYRFAGRAQRAKSKPSQWTGLTLAWARSVKGLLHWFTQASYSRRLPSRMSDSSKQSALTDI